LKDCGPMPTQFKTKSGMTRKRPRDVDKLMRLWMVAHPNWQSEVAS
jgi:hypothetical protein